MLTEQTIAAKALNMYQRLNSMVPPNVLCRGRAIQSRYGAYPSWLWDTFANKLHLIGPLLALADIASRTAHVRLSLCGLFVCATD